MTNPVGYQDIASGGSPYNAFRPNLAALRALPVTWLIGVQGCSSLKGCDGRKLGLNCGRPPRSSLLLEWPGTLRKVHCPARLREQLSGNWSILTPSSIFALVTQASAPLLWPASSKQDPSPHCTRAIGTCTQRRSTSSISHIASVMAGGVGSLFHHLNIFSYGSNSCGRCLHVYIHWRSTQSGWLEGRVFPWFHSRSTPSLLSKHVHWTFCSTYCWHMPRIRKPLQDSIKSRNTKYKRMAIRPHNKTTETNQVHFASKEKSKIKNSAVLTGRTAKPSAPVLLDGSSEGPKLPWRRNKQNGHSCSIPKNKCSLLGLPWWVLVESPTRSQLHGPPASIWRRPVLPRARSMLWPVPTSHLVRLPMIS